MRILVITPQYPPREGGVSDYSRRFCDELVARGHVVSVVTREGGSTMTPFRVWTHRGPWDLRSYGRLKSVVREFAPDVILLQYVPHPFNRRGPGLPVVSLIISLVTALRVPLIVYGHELYSPWNESWLSAPWLFAQRAAIVALVARSSRFVVTVEARRRRLARLLPWWSSRISSISVAPTLDSEHCEPNWRARMGIGRDERLIVAMGFAHPSKGTSSLHAIAEKVAGATPRVRVITIGGLSDGFGVEGWGYIDAHDAWNLLLSADLFVMPYSDGVSARRTSALNALAAGVPVLTTSGVNTDASLFNDSSMVLTPVGDEGALVDAAVALIDDPCRSRELGERGKVLVAKEFAWPVHMDRWEYLLGSR